MIRRIIHIDEEKCNGCGKCVHACHEGAIDLVNGKARLMREHYCDGLGDCLPSCPTGAITIADGRSATRVDLCTKCCACVKFCPVGGRTFDTPYTAMLHQNFSARREPECFV